MATIMLYRRASCLGLYVFMKDDGYYILSLGALKILLQDQQEKMIKLEYRMNNTRVEYRDTIKTISKIKRAIKDKTKWL